MLSHLHSKLKEEQTKNAILEEEIKELKTLLKVEIPKFSKPGWIRNSLCWFELHSFEVQVEPRFLNSGLVVSRKGFFDYCRIQCKHCGFMAKDFRMDINHSHFYTLNFGTLCKIVGLVDKLYEMNYSSVHGKPFISSL